MVFERNRKWEQQLRKSIQKDFGSVGVRKFSNVSLCYGPLYGATFEGGFKFTSVCIVIAIIAAVSAIVLFVLDKRLSKLVED